MPGRPAWAWTLLAPATTDLHGKQSNQGVNRIQVHDLPVRNSTAFRSWPVAMVSTGSLGSRCFE